MKLRDLAHIRTGDKGDTCQISVIAYLPEHYADLERRLTVDRVRSFYSGLACRTVKRHTLPALGALIFTLEGALKGGVTRSLALDPHGKTLGALLLDIDLAQED
jgi:hypothetical protein